MLKSSSPATAETATVETATVETAPRVTVAASSEKGVSLPAGPGSPIWFTAGECALVFLVTLFAAALFRWQLGGKDFVYAASGAAQLLSALGGVIACMIALRRMSMARAAGASIQGRDLWPWGLLATSLLCFGVAHALSIGEWLPEGNANRLGRQHVSGVDASFFWLLQYPLLWLGLLLLAWPDRVVILRARASNPAEEELSSVDDVAGQTQLMRVVTDRLIVVLALLVVFWKLLLEQPFFASYSPAHFALKSLVFCFPVAIAGHLFCGLMLLSAPRRRLHLRTLVLLLLALVLLAATDTVYALVVVQRFYAPGAVVDAGWIGAWLLFGVAALDGSEQAIKRRALSAATIPAVQADSRDVLRRRSARRTAVVWLPYVASLLACCVLLVREYYHSTVLSHVLPVVGLVMAVLVRQMLSLADNLSLAERLKKLNRDLECNVDDRTRHLSTLHSVTSMLNASLDDHAILRAALEGLMPATHATHGGIWLRPVVRPRAGSHRIHTRSDGAKISLETSQATTDNDEGDEGWTVECSPSLQDNEMLRHGLRRRAILQSLSGFTVHRDSTPTALPDVAATIVAAIRWQGVLLGVIGLMREAGEFSAADRALVNSVAVEAGAALQNARLYQEASRRADRDSVTELLNHRAVQQELHAVLLRSRQHATVFAVVMMDLSNFKFFNDTYGHLTGDDVLRTVAQTLSAACREADVVGRYGGDEFIAILPNTDAAGAREVCARIVGELDLHHFEAAPDSHIPIAMNFGLAVYPADGETPLELTNRADANLYQNKRNGNVSALPLLFNGHTASASHDDYTGHFGHAFGVLDALVTAIDNKDHYTRHHSEEVAQLAQLIVEELGYSSEMQRVVRIAALLHDVGKIAVPDSILRHPGRLGGDEAAIMRQHPIFGALIVRDIAHQDVVVSGVRHHHERYDGAGYPDGLCGENIPWMGRLLAVADVYSALTTDRPYRKALSPEAALYEIESGAGTQFDSEFAHTFVRVMRRELLRATQQPPSTAPALHSGSAALANFKVHTARERSRQTRSADKEQRKFSSRAADS